MTVMAQAMQTRIFYKGSGHSPLLENPSLPNQLPQGGFFVVNTALDTDTAI